MAKIAADAFLKALVSAGVVTDPDTVTRVIIDARPGKPLYIHVEHVGDERILGAVSTLSELAPPTTEPGGGV